MRDEVTRLRSRVATLEQLLQVHEESVLQQTQKLQQALDELARSNRELEQFAYVISHDLQEPLRVIVGYLQLLDQRYRDRLDGDAEEFIAFAVGGATRMHHLINDLLTYSRAGKRKEPEPVDLDRLLGDVLQNLAVALEESGAVVERAPLPVVIGDRWQLLQLFQNLVSNALKFRAEAPPQVRVECGSEGDHWVFAVSDNGIGIDPRFSEKIFGIFQRLHGRQKYPGTGIGLAICKKVVETLGGTISVESAPGEGSTFRFTLPRARRDSQ